MSRAELRTWKRALVRAIAGSWLVATSSEPVKNTNHQTADEKRALRAGYNTVAQYEKAMATKAKARRIHAMTS